MYIQEVDLAEVGRRLAAVAAGSAAAGDVDRLLLRTAYEDVDRLLRACPQPTDELRAGLGGSVFAPGSVQAVAPGVGVYLEGGCAGLGELLGKVDLCLPYPGLWSLFVDGLGVPGHLGGPDECLTLLRALRARGAEGAEPSAELAGAVYGFLLAASSGGAAGALAEVFASEPLVLVPGGPTGKATWRESASCMWLDSPPDLEIECASLAPHYPAELRQLFVEVLYDMV